MCFRRWILFYFISFVLSRLEFDTRFSFCSLFCYLTKIRNFFLSLSLSKITCFELDFCYYNQRVMNASATMQ